MTDHIEYSERLRLLYTYAGLIAGFDIPGLIEAIDKADALGPILDPTLWMQNHKAMDDNRALLAAFLPLWTFVTDKQKAVHE